MKSFRINIINLLNFSYFHLNYSSNVRFVFYDVELSERAHNILNFNQKSAGASEHSCHRLCVKVGKV